MFSSLLVANRGEIALRVMRTCRRLGIRTVAVYSDADVRSLHVRAADEAVRLGPGPATESYLRGELLVAAALATRVEAVHPGYGFLAEDAAFAQAVIDAGLAWVGPPPAAMLALGDKAHAKALAAAAGVPVLPGYHDDMAAREDGPAGGPRPEGRDGPAGGPRPEGRDGPAGGDGPAGTVTLHAAEVGFPLVVKAIAGGGGRGMRVVREPSELEAALASARREALAAFRDDRVLLERYLERPRHVEVQVLADAHGALVHLGERECSVQRRHQKLIEESPSPAVDDALRTAMGEAALRLCRAAAYEGAGTVEFLLDEAGRFFFLEVNARLQVEHPVTELRTGLDLVEQQLLVASGEALGFVQADIRLEGHAIEARVVAEDPAAGFLPQTGLITAFDVPPGVRVDGGFEAGSVVPPFYDSLLAKVIAHGTDRDAAIDRLADALEGTRIDGVATDLDLLTAALDEPAFRAGNLHTGFLAEHRVAERFHDTPEGALAAAAGARSLDPGGASRDPWRIGVPWRVGRVGERTRWVAGGRLIEAETSVDPHGRAAVVVGDSVAVVIPDGDAAGVVVQAIGAVAPSARAIGAVAPSARAMRVLVDGEPAEVRPRGVTWRGRRYRIALAPPPSAEANGTAAEEPDALVAPMPGRIVRVDVAVGDRVRANAPLLVLEAMKMEHVVAAAAPGRVARLHVAPGDQVVRGALLVDLDAEEGLV